MENTQSSLFARDDTFFGVCEALGQDFRINANVLRVAFALGFFFSPVAAVGLYLALGTVILVSRWLVPDPKTAAPAPVESVKADAEQEQAQAWEELAVAA